MLVQYCVIPPNFFQLSNSPIKLEEQIKRYEKDLQVLRFKHENNERILATIRGWANSGLHKSDLEWFWEKAVLEKSETGEDEDNRESESEYEEDVL
jgi:hypothetical protein